MAPGLGGDKAPLLRDGFDIRRHDFGDGVGGGFRLFFLGAGPNHVIGVQTGDGRKAVGTLLLKMGGAEGHTEGLLGGDGPAAVGHVGQPHPGGIAQIDIITDAVDLVGALRHRNGAVIDDGVPSGTLLQPVPQLDTGHLHHTEGDVITVEGVTVGAGQAYRFLSGLIQGHGLLRLGRSQSQVRLSGPEHGLVQQIHGVALPDAGIDGPVPLPGGGGQFLGQKGVCYDGGFQRFRRDLRRGMGLGIVSGKGAQSEAPGQRSGQQQGEKGFWESHETTPLFRR